jgi:thiol-disulfide isomerase/thioredoxin
MFPWLLIACVLARPASASELEDAQDNFETVVRSHVAAKSKDGVWILKRAGGKAFRLTMTGVERATVHRVPPGRWSGIADFEDAGTKKAYFAEVTADLTSELWEVKDVHWLDRKEAAAARVAGADAAQSASSQRRPGPFGLMPELKLTALDGRETYLPDCGKPKCLTVVVAPWCPHCRAAAGVIAALRDWLPDHDVGMRIIVSRDTDDAVRDYAESFGPATLTDPSALFQAGGVPAFIVSTDGGAILKKVNGAWEDEKDPAKYASMLDLP